MAGRTVTIQSARPGVRRVTVGDRTFVVGEPTVDVPEPVLRTLKARDDLTLHVAQPARKRSDDDENPDPQAEE